MIQLPPTALGARLLYGSSDVAVRVLPTRRGLAHRLAPQAALAAAPTPVTATQRVLFPESQPRRHGTLHVDAPHALSWEEHGTADGVPIVVIHGGPGAGCFSNHA